MYYYRIFFFVLFNICFFLESNAQKNSALEKEFAELSIYAEQGNYKAGYFYSTKIKSTLIKKSCNELDLLRSNCYIAYFADKLDKTEEVNKTLVEINKKLPALSDLNNKDKIALTFGTLCEFYFQRGIYTITDSIYSTLKETIKQLSAFDRSQIEYYHLEALYNEGFLNKVSEQSSFQIKALASRLVYDSVYVSTDSYKQKKLTLSQKVLRENLLARYILLKARTQLANEFSDSTISYLKDQFPFLRQEIKGREGYTATVHYLIGTSALENKDFLKAEREFKMASGLAQRFYLPHAPKQIDIERGLVKSLIAQGKGEEAAYYNNDIKIRIYGYYTKNNLSYLTNGYSDVEDEIINKEWQNAENMVRSFLSEPAVPKQHDIRYKYLITLFDVLVNQQKYESADSIITEALMLQSSLTGIESPTYKITQLKKANYYTFNQDKFSEAELLYNGILNTDFKKEIPIENPDYYSNIISLSTLHQYKEDYKSAEKILIDNSNEIEKEVGKRHPIYAVYESQLGNIKIDVGDYKSAAAYLMNATDIFEKADQKKYIRDYIKTLELIIKLQVLQGNYQEAEQLFSKTKKIASQSGISERDDIFLLDEIGLLYIKEGEYQKAERLLTVILNNKESIIGNSHKSLCATLNYLGELNLEIGNYGETDKYFNRSLQINKKIFGDKSIPYATSLLYYKQLYAAIGDYEKAESSINDALKIFIKTYGDNNIKTGALMHEAALASFEADQYTSRKQKNTAIDIENQFSKALQTIQANVGVNSVLYAEGLENASMYFAQTNQFSKALSNIEQAKKIWETNVGVLNIHSARLDFLSGKIYYKSTQYPTALTYFEKSRDEYKSIFDEDHPGYIFALGSCAQINYILGNTSKSIDNIEECTNKSLLYLDRVFPFLSERGKMAYWDKIKDDFDFYKTIAFTNSKQYPEMIGKILNIQLQTKSLLLNSTLKIKNRIYASGDTASIRLYENWQNMRDGLSVAYSLTSAQRKENAIDISLLEDQIENIEKQLSSISQDFVENNKIKNSDLYNWKNLKKSLSEDEIMIETIPFRYFNKNFTDTVWYAFIAVTAKSSTPTFIIEKNGRDLENKHLKYYRNTMKFEQADNNSYKQYWKPISTLIEPKYSTIYFAGDGVYNQINLETLKDEQENYLINSKNIVCIGTGRDIINKKEIEKTKHADTGVKSNITMIGNPVYYTVTPEDERSINQLPGSEEEVKTISTFLKEHNWSTTVYIGSSATEDTVKKLQNPEVLHISTHGFFWNDNSTTSSDEINEKSVTNPLLTSGVLLYNGGELLNTSNINTINKTEGILTAYEAMNLSLDKTELVVLSACETGLGEVKVGEGVYGLQRSFTVAGARCIIMSLSKVSDEVTIKLMEYFYKYWLQSGNKRDAFIKAKKDLMKEYPSPKYWGAFIMIGL